MRADSDQFQEHRLHQLYYAPTDYLYEGPHSVKPFPLAEIEAAIKTDIMLRQLLFFLIVATPFYNCTSQQDTNKTTTDSITRLEMNLSAFGVEADDFPLVEAHIDFLNDSSRCEKTYYNLAFKPSIYRLTSTEIKKILQLLRATDINKLKTE